MSDNSSVEKFNYYTNYIWQANDFATFQDNMLANTGNLAGAFGVQAILRGFGLSGMSSSSLNVTVGSGTCVSKSDQISVVPNATTLSLLAPTGGNPCWSVAVVRPSLMDQNFIPNPSNPLAPAVPLNELFVGTPMIINGVSTASPSYPTLGAQDVVLMGFKMQAGASGFSQIVLDPTMRNAAGRLPTPMTSASGSYSVLSTDRFVEVDASAGVATLTLPPIASVPGHELKLLKSDSSTNAVNVTPNGTDNIDGSTTALPLLGQNDSITMISESNEWKVLSASPNRRRLVAATTPLGGMAISNSSGSFNTASTSYVNVTNLSVTLTTGGNPVDVRLISDTSGAISNISLTSGSALQGKIQLLNNGSVIHQSEIQSTGSVNLNSLNIPVSSFNQVDTSVSGIPGTYTYTVQIALISGNSIFLTNARLCAFEILR